MTTNTRCSICGLPLPENGEITGPGEFCHGHSDEDYGHGDRARELFDNIVDSPANAHNPAVWSSWQILEAFDQPVPPERVITTTDDFHGVETTDEPNEETLPKDSFGNNLTRWDLIRATAMTGNVYEGEYGRWISWTPPREGGWHDGYHRVAWGGRRPCHEVTLRTWSSPHQPIFKKVGHLEKYIDQIPYIGDVIYMAGGSMGLVIDIDLGRAKIYWIASHEAEEWLFFNRIKRIARIGRSKKQIFEF